jgi:UDP-N-acetylglucosamine 2-epimerase (non-hydrolysing)
MKISIIYGTRPEFLKLKCLIDKLKTTLTINVIKIRQHTHNIDDEGYYDKVIEIDNSSDNRLSNIGSSILLKLPSLINDSSHILAQGDTASVYYSLLCGFQMNKKCIHLEAGMRTYDLENPFPEEGYRQMISRITDIHLCPSEMEKEILISEKVKGQIFVVGNTILDLVKSYEFPITFENSVVITLHRRENWHDFKDYLIELAKFASKNKDLIFNFLTHPNPSFKEILNEIALSIPTNMKISNALPHQELIELLSRCAFVITDSGGIQEEANFLGKHIYIIRKITERQAINSSKITLCNLDNIYLINNDIVKHQQGFEYGNGNSCDSILNIFNNL